MRVLCHLLFVLLLVLLAPAFVWADEARPVYIEVIEGQSDSPDVAEFTLKWKIPPVMAAAEEPSISLKHPACTLSYGQMASGLLGHKRYRCDLSGIEGDQLAVKLDYPFNNPALSSLVVFKGNNAEPIQLFSSPDKTLISIPLVTSAKAVAYQYTVVGIEHILIGTDHLLFVLCLMLIAGTFKRLLITVTGFTLAHSLTLSLATLGIVRLPSELVEFLIALSIVLLAVEIVKYNRQKEQKQRSFTWRYPVTVATVFGLLHGFGFASVLQELGLPASMKLHALLFFNVGVELGQLLFILLVTVAMVLAMRILRFKFNHNGINATGYAIGICSSYWLLERAIVLL